VGYADFSAAVFRGKNDNDCSEHFGFLFGARINILARDNQRELPWKPTLGEEKSWRLIRNERK
jgi:hypothetical protein